MAVGNNTGVDEEEGSSEALKGVVLLNDGKGNFTYLPPHKSGFDVPEEGRDIEIIESKSGKQILVGTNNGPIKRFTID